MRAGIENLPGLKVAEVADPTGNPITRLRVQSDRKLLNGLVRHLESAPVPVAVRGGHLDLGYFELDPCNLGDDEARAVVDRIRSFFGKTVEIPAPAAGPPGLGPRFSRYDDLGRPAVDPDMVPWLVRAPDLHPDPLGHWPDRYLPSPEDSKE